MWGKSGASSAPQCDGRLLVVLRLFAGGKAKSYPLFSGEIHAGKHAAQGKWGTILKESTPVFPAFPSQKSLGFWGDGSALLPCHASLPSATLDFPPTRNKFGRALPVLEFIPRCSPVKLLRGLGASSLSRFACSRRPVSLRLGTAIAGCARLTWLFLASLHPACSRRLSASMLSRLACSRRLASLRFGTGMAGYACLMPIPHFGPSSLLTTARRFYATSIQSASSLRMDSS